MFGPRKPTVAFGNSAPYQNAKGDWKVLVTIDNANQVERDATADEIAAVAPAAPAQPVKADPVHAEPASKPAPPKKSAKGKKG